MGTTTQQALQQGRILRALKALVWDGVRGAIVAGLGLAFYAGVGMYLSRTPTVYVGFPDRVCYGVRPERAGTCEDPPDRYTIQFVSPYWVMR